MSDITVTENSKNVSDLESENTSFDAAKNDVQHNNLVSVESEKPCLVSFDAEQKCAMNVNTGSTNLIIEDCDKEDNLIKSRSECEKSEKESRNDESNEMHNDRRSRKRTSSNISDILNLEEENSSDDDSSDNQEIPSNKKHSPIKQNSENEKHRSKKRSRRFRKRKWKPYFKLTWQEQQKVQERDLRKAQRTREELTKLGIALAPDNTTDFLIKDQMISSPDYSNIYENKVVYSSIYRDFEEDYACVRRQYLSKFKKSELIENWIEREDEIEAVEKRLNAIREQRKLLGLGEHDRGSGMTKIEVFRNEIRNLMIENKELQEQNARMRKYLEEHKL